MLMHFVLFVRLRNTVVLPVGHFTETRSARCYLCRGTLVSLHALSASEWLFTARTAAPDAAAAFASVICILLERWTSLALIDQSHRSLSRFCTCSLMHLYHCLMLTL